MYGWRRCNPPNVTHFCRQNFCCTKHINTPTSAKNSKSQKVERAPYSIVREGAPHETAEGPDDGDDPD